MPDYPFFKFFELLRFSLGTSVVCPRMHVSEWQAAHEISKKQAISAFIGSSLMSIKENVLIEDDEKSKDAFNDLIMEWTGDVVKTAQRNQKLNEDVIEEFAKLEAKGLQCCLLKGQGNALMYPNPGTRTTGDIDVWVRFVNQANDKSNIHRIIRFVKKVNPGLKATYHHIDAPDINGTPVEIHYRPGFLMSPIYNNRIQRIFAINMDAQFNHKVKINNTFISVPTASFNVVFQLSHIFNHLTHEGIGLRQLLDYHFVLSGLHRQDVDTYELSKKLNRLGLLKFAKALMWILVNRFGMDESNIICGMDERRGRFILNEIMLGGNFGKYDNRSEVKYFDNPIIVQYRHLIRNLHLFRYFPHQSLIEPIGRGLLFFRKKSLNNIRL